MLNSRLWTQGVSAGHSERDRATNSQTSQPKKLIPCACCHHRSCCMHCPNGNQITIVSLTFTQAMSSYWAVSSLFAVSQNLSLRFPIVRRSLGIPKTPSEPEKPMRHLFESAKTNFAEFKADVREKNFKG